MGGGDNLVEDTVEAKFQGLECKDPMEIVLSSIHNLYTVRDTFFPLDPTIKKARLDNLMRDVLLVLNEISSGVYRWLLLALWRLHWKCCLLCVKRCEEVVKEWSAELQWQL